MLTSYSAAGDSFASEWTRSPPPPASPSERCTITSRARMCCWQPYSRCSTNGSSPNFRPLASSCPAVPTDWSMRSFVSWPIWSAKPQWAGSGFTRLAMELADLPGHPARSIARQHKAALEKYLAGLLAEANVRSPGDRARELLLLTEGAMVMILIHGDRSYAEAAARAAKRLVSGSQHDAASRSRSGRTIGKR